MLITDIKRAQDITVETFIAFFEAVKLIEWLTGCICNVLIQPQVIAVTRLCTRNVIPCTKRTQAI